MRKKGRVDFWPLKLGPLEPSVSAGVNPCYNWKGRKIFLICLLGWSREPSTDETCRKAMAVTLWRGNKGLVRLSLAGQECRWDAKTAMR